MTNLTQIYNEQQLSTSQQKLQQQLSGPPGVNTANQTGAASVASPLSPADSECSGCSYSVRHKLHVSEGYCRTFIEIQINKYIYI